MIAFWDDLDIDEKNVVLSLINSNRTDLRWIKAMLLVKDEIPKEVEVKILGDINFYSLKPSKVLELLPEQLVQDCLRIIYVQHYEHEYLRPSYLSGFWKKIINYILYFEVKPYFYLCIKDFIGHNIWANRSENFLLWRKICVNSKDIDYLTYLVIYNISKSTIYINGTTIMFENLIFAYKKRNEYDRFIKIIVEEIEVLQQSSDKIDIFEYLGKDLIIEDLYKKMHPDSILKLISIKDAIAPLVKIIDKIDSFRFFFSYLMIKKIIKENVKMDEETKIKLLSIPNKIDMIGKIKQKELKNKYFKDERLIDWGS